MQVIYTSSQLSAFCREQHKAGKTIALVPTMGYYHAGHEALMDQARSLADIVIVSLFVNPTQFGPNEDFAAYPRDFERDAAIAKSHGADVLFAPQAEQLYPGDMDVWVDVPDMSSLLCGSSRPIHFRGVCTVCSKLFSLTQADYAVFGNKDWQQQAIIRYMVKNLFFPVQIVGIPIQRAEDGLALSSRNVYLTAEERAQAPEIYKGLQYAKELVAQGETRVSVLKDLVLRRWSSTLSLGRLDYLSIVHPETLRDIDDASGPALILCAIKMGKARLIDNLLLH